MLRSLFACAGLLAILPLSLAAQQKICVFQEKKGAADKVSDAAALAAELNARSLQTVVADGISKHSEDAEAAERGCSWIVRVWREDPPPASNTYFEPGSGVDGAISSDMARSMAHAKFLEFSLRPAGSKKIAARGSSQDASPYTKFAGQIAKKIAKEK
jgi:hypothetical protein